MKRLGCGVLFVALSLLGCSQGAVCGPASCNGCCSSVGECVEGNLSRSCGSGGATCAVCAGNQTCELGACNLTSTGNNDSGTCGEESCAGCCQGSQCILVGNENDVACGTNGQACQGCSGGSQCIDGQCSLGSGDGGACGPSNCDGCCEGYTCIPMGNEGPSDCGKGGLACQSCAGTCAGGMCSVPDGGGCGLQTCGGCCEATTCVALLQESDLTCGFAGAACTSCMTGTTCSNGACEDADAGSCDPTVCLGCCLGNNCLPPDQQSSFACGSFVTCAPCVTGTSCQDGQCSPVPDAGACDNCAGCCNNDTCIPIEQETDDDCGTGGAACTACFAGITSCQAGACQISSDGGSCSVLSCLTGCCLFGSCVDASQETNFDCGLFGQTCQICQGTDVCSGGTCQAATGG
jgi:hypothetical protein